MACPYSTPSGKLPWDWSAEADTCSALMQWLLLSDLKMHSGD